MIREILAVFWLRARTDSPARRAVAEYSELSSIEYPLEPSRHLYPA